MDFSPSNSESLSPWQRLLLAVGSLGGLVALLIAGNLVPDGRGFGTHEQLGLSPCTFYQWTGWTCPTCGCTTAWALLLRGQVTAALATHLAGTLLCLLTVLVTVWLGACAVQGRWIAGRPSFAGLVALAWGWMALAVFDWLRRTVF